MAKKITQYPASAGNPDVTSLLDISEFDGSIFTSKKIAISQLLTFLNSNLNLGSSFTFKNNTGKTILKGSPVEIDDASGLDLPEVVLIAQSFSRRGLSQVFIATETVLNGNSGAFIQNGFIDIDTSSYPVGTKIFWNISTEMYTVLASEIDQVFIGVVTVQSATGQMFVSPVRGLKTLTSQFTNDGDDTINPFITALDVPAVPTLTSDLTNDGADGLNPFITALDIPTFASADKMVTIGRNSTGSTLYRGTIVYISGSTGNRPNFVKARANIEATSAGTFGVIESDILNNADGNCVTIGSIGNLDTRSSATHPFTVDTLADGDTIYLSPTTAGYITNVEPSAPNHLVYIGKVVRTSPTLGTIVYRIQNGYELEELHNVAISSVTNNDILQYETSTSLWKNKAIPTASGSTNGYLSSTDWTTFNGKQNETTSTTGSVISFATPQVYNTPASPSSSNLTDSLTGAKIGVVQKIYSNKSVAPTVPAGWVLIGTGTYTISTLNIIFAEWVSSTRVEYWITKPQ